MTGIILFTIALVLIGIVFRFAGSAYYDRIYKETLPDNISEDSFNEDELIAVISAAIADDLQSKVVVRKISLLSQADDSAWKRTGKLTIMSSHAVQPKH